MDTITNDKPRIPAIHSVRRSALLSGGGFRAADWVIWLMCVPCVLLSGQVNGIHKGEVRVCEEGHTWSIFLPAMNREPKGGSNSTASAGRPAVKGYSNSDMFRRAENVRNLKNLHRRNRSQKRGSMASADGCALGNVTFPKRDGTARLRGRGTELALPRANWE
jgi:hypothetical protein